MKVKFNGGIKDVAISEVTAENYIVPQREEKFYHVKQEKVEFDRNTGKRLSRAVIQKYDKKAYVTTVKYLQDAGYTIVVLHDPVAWEKANAVQTAAAEKQKADAEREAMKAELRKEMKAELLKELKDELKANKETKGNGRGGNRKNGKGAAAAETTETPEESAEGTENENND